MATRRAILRAGALVPLLAACAPDLLGDSDTVRVGVSWSGTELAAFRTVLAGIRGVPRLEVVPLGDDIDTAFTAAGRAAPDIVMLPQAGQVRSLAADHRLRPVSSTLWPETEQQRTGDTPRYPEYWRQLLFHGDKPYGIPFKASAKSLVWFDRESVRDLDLGDPAGWTVEDWIDRTAVLAGGSRRFLALAAADGWVLTDLFENMLLAESPADYDDLAAPTGERRWNRDSVRAALGHLGALWGVRAALPGGAGHALTRQFPDAVREVFDRRTAVMVVMPDFAEPIVRRCLRHTGRAEEVVGTAWFPPVRAGLPRPRIVGGDVAVITDQAADAADRVVEALAAPQAPAPWIEEYGGFLGPNQRTSARYSATLAPVAAELAAHRYFDLSDRIGAVGGRDGLWRVLADYLKEIGDGAGPVDPAVDRAVSALDDFERRQR